MPKVRESSPRTSRGRLEESCESQETYQLRRTEAEVDERATDLASTSFSNRSPVFFGTSRIVSNIFLSSGDWWNKWQQLSAGVGTLNGKAYERTQEAIPLAE